LSQPCILLAKFWYQSRLHCYSALYSHHSSSCCDAGIFRTRAPPSGVKSAYHKWIELQGIPILLVDLPQARRCKFKQMPVGIPKIDTAPAARPYGLTFDDDIGCAEALFPVGQLRRVDREGYVQWTTTVVRRNGTAAHFYRLKRSAALEEQEHAAISRSESAHSVIGK